MKAKFLAAPALAAVMLLSGCGSNAPDANTYEKIQSTLVSMESFQTEAEVTYISNKNSHTYGTIQQAKIGGQYRIEVTSPDNVAGSTTISDGVSICQFNPKAAGQVSVTTTDSPERYEILLTSFVENYVKSNEVTVTSASLDESKCTVLEATITGDHPYMATEKLWVDNETLEPVRLVIYDADQGERVVVNYGEFEYNVVLEDSLFTVQ